MKLPLPPRNGFGRKFRIASLLAGLFWLLAMTSLPAAGQAPAQASGEAAQPSGSSSGHQLILCQDGTVMGWGDNTYGQLNNNSSVVVSPVVVPMPPGAAIVAVAMSSSIGVNCGSSFAIQANGQLLAWGANHFGQLGIGSTATQTSQPTTVVQANSSPLLGVVAVVAAREFTIALCQDGTVWSWGDNSAGVLGDSSPLTSQRTYARQIPPSLLHGIVAIKCSDETCLALDTAGDLYSWGSNPQGALGLGLSAYVAVQPSPAKITTLQHVRLIEAGATQAMAVCVDGTVWAWGKNTSSELGLGSFTSMNQPTRMPSIVDGAIDVAVNFYGGIATMANGSTYVWGDNTYGGIGQATLQIFLSPVAGPPFPAGTRIAGYLGRFVSVGPTGTVKTWGNTDLGYTASTPTPVGTYSSVPTTPSGLCPSAVVDAVAGCGPLRRYYQRSGATYVAAAHGNTASPAEIGTYGTTTVIDASQPPYNGIVVFDGIYHLRGDVKFANGTFSLLDNTVFYVDSDNGQAVNAPNYTATTILVEKATLQLRAATLQANCPDLWGGVALTGYGKVYTSGGGRKGSIRSVIRDAGTGVYSYTPDWQTANTNEYYLLQTDFINDNVGLYDLVKGTAQPGEGARYCTFSHGSTGIQFEAIDSSPGTTFGGDFSNALFDYNTFDDFAVGIGGLAGQVHITNSTFTNNYYAAILVDAAPGSVGEIRHNGITVPATWPAVWLAGLGSGSTPTSYGIAAPYGGLYDITDNTIEGSTPDPTTNNVEQIGLDLGSNSLVHGSNRIRYLDQGLNLTTNDQTGSSHDIEGNTFTDNLTGVAFSRYSNYPYYQAAVNVTLRCNTFSSTITGATGVWVKAGALFPAALGGTGTGSNPPPNGNRFDGITNDKKRFVYEAGQPAGGVAFRYFRYNSAQESFAGGNGSDFYTYNGSLVPSSIGFAPITQIAGTSACGGSTTPGVYARSVNKTSTPNSADSSVSLSGAYPNPAAEILTFAYTRLADSPPADLVLRDLLGREVARQQLAASIGEVRISVRHLPAGLYTSALESAGRRLFGQKIMVTH